MRALWVRVMQGSDSLHDWRPLLVALEYADLALCGDAWRLMTQWNQAGSLPMQGRADGTTRDFQRHWFDYVVSWGSDEPVPSLPPDKARARPSVGPGRTTSRPRRSALAPRITATIDAASPPRLYGSDDILWFDHSAARAKGVDVPQRVSNVLVDMTALRRLCTGWQQPSDAKTATPHVPAVAPVLHTVAEPKPAAEATAIADSRPNPTNPAVRQWFRDRVATWLDDQPAPSELGDWRSITQHFAPGIARKEFRIVRQQETPAAWRKQGPRPPWGVAKQSADQSANLPRQN